MVRHDTPGHMEIPRPRVEAGEYVQDPVGETYYVVGRRFHYDNGQWEYQLQNIDIRGDERWVQDRELNTYTVEDDPEFDAAAVEQSEGFSMGL